MDMSWIYQEKPINELPNDCVGFVYQITNTTNGKMYIGKKLAKFSRSRKPLKGRVNKRRYKKQKMMDQQKQLEKDQEIIKFKEWEKKFEQEQKLNEERERIKEERLRQKEIEQLKLRGLDDDQIQGEISSKLQSFNVEKRSKN